MYYGSIYKIVFPNGKHYIGLTTTSLEQRKKKHSILAKNDTRILYNAIRKHKMVDTFELIEIDTADTLKELCEKEIGYISIEYNSYYMNGNGYNMTYGGEGLTGYVFTDEVKQKISENTKKAKSTPEGKQKNSAGQIKRYENKEERQKQSERMRNRIKTHPDMGERISISKKKHYKDNPEARQRQSEARIKHFEKPGAREEHSKSQKKRFENPEERKKSSRAKENKPFDVFKKDGTFIGTFTYQFEASEYLKKEYNINITSKLKISEVLSGKRKYSHGFVFKYK
jgi:hypothetical protein